jgi:hypothetical protein
MKRLGQDLGSIVRTGRRWKRSQDTDVSASGGDDATPVRWDLLTTREPQPSAKSPHHETWRRVCWVTGSPTGIYEPTNLDRTLKFRVFNTGFIAAAVGLVGFLVLLIVVTVVAFRRTTSTGAAIFLALLCVLGGAWCLLEMTRNMCVLVTRTGVQVRMYFRSRTLPIADLINVTVVENVEDGRYAVEVKLLTRQNVLVRTPLRATRSLAGRATTDESCFALRSALELRGCACSSL